jgi:hypothetical protein
MENLSKEDALILAIPWMHRTFTVYLHEHKVNLENYKEHMGWIQMHLEYMNTILSAFTEEEKKNLGILITSEEELVEWLKEYGWNEKEDFIPTDSMGTKYSSQSRSIAPPTAKQLDLEDALVIALLHIDRKFKSTLRNCKVSEQNLETFKPMTENHFFVIKPLISALPDEAQKVINQSMIADEVGLADWVKNVDRDTSY